MLSFYKKYWRTAFDIAVMLVTIYLFMLLFSWLWKIAAPIFLAFLVFAVVDPPARFLHRKGMKKSVATSLSMLIFILVILGVLIGAGVMFTSQILSLADKIPQYQSVLQDQIATYADELQNRLNALPPNITDKLKEFSGTITKYGSQFARWFLTTVFVWLSSFSSFVVNFAVAIILAYFLSIEIEGWKRLANHHTPRTFKTVYFFLKENVLAGIGSYIKSQLKLISITFVIIFVALLVLGVKNSFSVSLLSAVFDLLPLLGVSTLFIPWILYLFVVGQTNLAIWLCVLLGAVILIRQIMEPKITGDSLGVSAFTMLSFMIISLSLFGISGLILSPILIILIKALIDQGYLQKWIRLPAEEYDRNPQEPPK